MLPPNLMKFMMFCLLGIFLMGNTGCEDIASNTPEYVEGGIQVYDQVKDVDFSGNTASDAKEIVDKVQSVTSVVTKFVPQAAPYEMPIKAGLGILSFILGLFAVKKSKDSRRHEARADNYSEAIESGIAEGEDQTVISVDALKTHLDKDTKAHFNGAGASRL